MDVIAETGAQALYETAQAILRTGVEVAPRGRNTKERRHFSVQINNPYDVMCTNINANYNQELAAAEAIQLIGGFSDPEFAIKHAPKLQNFVNDEGTFDGAYGPRVEKVLEAIVARLQSDQDTRQAIIPIWNSGDAVRDTSKDYPCTLSLGFYIRNDELEMDVTMRSNDVNWGLKYDMFQFTQLQLSVAHVLGIHAGPYRHTAFSMHLYEPDWPWAEDLINRFGDGTGPHGIQGRSVVETFARARLIAKNDLGKMIPTVSESWYLKALHGDE